MYTYSSSEPISLGSVTGTLYYDIKSGNDLCQLVTTASSSTYYYRDLILYEVDGVQYCYFTRGFGPRYAILGNNAEIGLTINTYVIDNGTVTQGQSQYLDSSSPSDYFENARTGNFTLEQR